MDINGHDTKIQTKEMLGVTIKTDCFDMTGKIMKVEKPYILFLQVDPWNSELHQFETFEKAMELVTEVSK